jgi:hypothetical protein
VGAWVDSLGGDLVSARDAQIEVIERLAMHTDGSAARAAMDLEAVTESQLPTQEVPGAASLASTTLPRPETAPLSARARGIAIVAAASVGVLAATLVIWAAVARAPTVRTGSSDGLRSEASEAPSADVASPARATSVAATDEGAAPSGEEAPRLAPPAASESPPTASAPASVSSESSVQGPTTAKQRPRPAKPPPGFIPDKP